MPQSGLYEQLITTAFRRKLTGFPDERQSVAPIDKAEPAEVLFRYGRMRYHYLEKDKVCLQGCF